MGRPPRRENRTGQPAGKPRAPEETAGLFRLDLCQGSPKPGGKMENLEQDVLEAPVGPSAPPTLRAHVVQMLSAGILSGKYKPGDRLNESQIARELNISRIPVREALSQLQEQGLVQNRERRGMFVTHINTQEVDQIFAVRLLLEGEVLRLARSHMTPEIRAELEGIISRMEAWD